MRLHKRAALLIIAAFTVFLDTARAGDPGEPCFDDVNFAFDSDGVVDAPRALKSVAGWLKANPKRRIRIVGQTDQRGGSEYNIVLSARRAEAVKKTLIEKYSVDPSQIERLEGKGEIQNGEDPDERFAARRVRIELIGGACETTKDSRDETHADGYRDEVRERLSQLSDPVFLIALIPDPVDSHLSRDFDVYLSSMREAMGSIGYHLDRFELPWPRFGSEKMPELQARWAPQDAAALQKSLTRFRRTPGVLIFRDPEAAKGRPTEVVAYLVGETPTWGLQTAAFRDALDRIEEHRRNGHELRKVGLLGPTYSGTVDSLARELGRPEVSGRGLPGISIVSGTASRGSNGNKFEGIERVTYKQIPVSTDYRLQKLIESLRKRDAHIGCEDIVLLRESSVFAADAEEGSPLCGSTPLRSINYPINISEVRRAHEALAMASPQRDGLFDWDSRNEASTDPIFQQSRLPISLSETATPDDRVPTYGADLTPQTVDMIIGEVLRKLDLEDALAIGIIGTNIRDKLFLASEIAKHAGDIRMFTDESDILLAHPRFNFATHGMLTISSNRLFDKDDANGRQSFFASDAAHGYFRAARQLAAELDAGKDPGGIPENDSDKALWAGIVGRGQIVLTGCNTASGCDSTPRSLFDDLPWSVADPPRKRIWLLLALLQMLMAAIAVLRVDGETLSALKRQTGRACATLFALTPVAILAPGLSGNVAHLAGEGSDSVFGYSGFASFAVAAVIAFAAVILGVVVLGQQQRADLLKQAEQYFHAKIARSDGASRLGLRSTGVLVRIMVSALTVLLAAPCFAIAFKLATPRHAALDTGLSLAPPAAMAQMVAMGFWLLYLERYRLRVTLGSEAKLGGAFRFFGLAPESWKRRVGLLGGVFLIPMLADFPLGFPLARTLEGSRPADLAIAGTLLGLSLCSVESLSFAWRLSRTPALLWKDHSQGQEIRKRRTLPALWRLSLLAGPTCMLAFLLAIEMYPFQPRGLLVTALTFALLGEVFFAVWMLLRVEMQRAPSKEGELGLGNLLGVFRRESAPLLAVGFVSMLGLLPNVRERLGGFVDLLSRLIG